MTKPSPNWPSASFAARRGSSCRSSLSTCWRRSRSSTASTCWWTSRAWITSAIAGPRDRFGLVYLLANTETNERLTVRTFVNEPEPAVPSVVKLWEGANWLEREVWDMFGIRFAGHPDLRRICCRRSSRPFRCGRIIPCKAAASGTISRCSAGRRADEVIARLYSCPVPSCHSLPNHALEPPLIPATWPTTSRSRTCGR